MESDCCNILMDEGEIICPFCRKRAEPIETEEEVQERLRGQDGDYEYIKNNVGLTDH